jgi:calcineurin-like phosphoesterase family protein
VQCANIVLIWGNHDQRGRGDPRFEGLFQSTHDILELSLGEQFFVLCHYAMRVWNHSHHGAYHLYGHSHGTLPDDANARSFDCGVDCFDFKPISLEQVTAVMQTKHWQPIDHHGRGHDEAEA